ncbi:MAG: hypothetical protein SVX43_19635, partial [Cyanobacteriota bacterium]|nr:hypothetical protein [Cyanobacteriota bacterium]
EEELDNAILLRTCKRIVDFLTTETGQEPSEIFIYLWFQGNSLTLVILLLKLILVCPNSRTHLEMRIASLIEYYQEMSEENCQWAIKFFEIFQITFAIYADNDVQYNLIKIKEHQTENDENSEDAILDSYGIFSQCRERFSEAWSEHQQVIGNRE